ncbi:hypothetical protein LEN26_013898 [Aphanomyces euteiches]|nr:hypothetical protein AeMF1_021527 [Aphanomyces euteiches]KAH9110021.1 hypothetical protein LEN26_013898 [Aphanomyces euteiches]KAH9197701.1 hypothetical protein AeNC1_000345 [Aphanomyces euteiches]
MQDDMQCRYAYKECTNMRTFKRDGQLHRLCELHRSKANALQKVYATKRRRELREQKRHVMERTLASLAIQQQKQQPQLTQPSIVVDAPKELGISWLELLDMEPIPVLDDALPALPVDDSTYLSDVFEPWFMF